ncbi:hypothetical protein LCGC14_1305520 [marine sediment metagenome]|uniref:DNA-binding phage zinc finger domain-containing protein n=1 Tax=marine sediment metagenome TaxID=412755 RepID=A0A0F9NRH6_9ZZZZ
MSLHNVSVNKSHWAIGEEGCPTCNAASSMPCFDLSNKPQRLPSNSVHVSRVRANGHNARGE